MFFYFLLRNTGCDYTHADTVAGCHLWASSSTSLSLAVFFILRKTSQRYSTGSKLWLRIFAKTDIRRAKRTPASGLPTKKLLLRYFAILRICRSQMLFTIVILRRFRVLAVAGNLQVCLLLFKLLVARCHFFGSDSNGVLGKRGGRRIAAFASVFTLKGVSRPSG